ncbi:MAG TPA: hypothetical protein VJN39_04935 [Gemmatimonadales bacterium]|nr:hypothetical protein [Gemmatimonadales bacterium]
MRRSLILSAVALTSYTASAHAQGGSTLSSVAGTWVTESTVGPKDSVVARGLLTATADGKGWTLKYPGHDPIPVRVAASGGDSVVTEAGPYPSILRPGQTVTLLRIVAHFKGETMSGTFEAHYSSGAVLRGKTTAARKK